MVGRAEGVQTPQGLADLPNVKKSSYVPDAEIDPVNSYAQITNYNNYYEFGTAKTDPARYSGAPHDAAVDREDRRDGREAGRLSD